MAKKTYYVWAEHSNGQSAAHTCCTGAYDDPTDSFERAVSAETAEEAQELGERLLAERVAGWPPCACGRPNRVGTEAWWRSASVIVSATPYPEYSVAE